MATVIFNTKIKEVHNKIPDHSGLVKRTYYDAKIFDIEKKYFTIYDYNRFKCNILHAKIKKNRSFDQSDISNLAKKF